MWLIWDKIEIGANNEIAALETGQVVKLHCSSFKDNYYFSYRNDPKFSDTQIICCNQSKV